MTWKSYAAVSGAGLLATYLFSTPPALGPQRPAASPPAASPRAAQPLVDIAGEAERLQARSRTDTEFREPSRNPFRFAARPAPPRGAPSAAAVPAEPTVAPDPLPQPAPILLNGIETNTVDGVRQRRAFLMTAEGPIAVREGDRVGSEYRVARIDADAVELVASDGTPRRISLR